MQIILRVSTPRLLASIVNSWVGVFLFRRDLLSIFVHVFTLYGTFSADQLDVEIHLDQFVINELLCACLLAPTAVTDLRAEYVPYVFGTDASSTRAGVVRAEVGTALSGTLCLASSAKLSTGGGPPPEPETSDVCPPSSDIA